MTDLSELQSTISVKIAGADSAGIETNFVNSTGNGDIKSADLLNISALQTTISVTTSTVVELKVGATRLTNRKSIQIQAQGTGIVYGYTVGSQLFTLANGATISLSVGDNIGVWVTRASGAGSATLAIAELA